MSKKLEWAAGNLAQFAVATAAVKSRNAMGRLKDFDAIHDSHEDRNFALVAEMASMDQNDARDVLRCIAQFLNGAGLTTRD